MTVLYAETVSRRYSFVYFKKISPQGTIKTIKMKKTCRKNTYTYTSKKF